MEKRDRLVTLLVTIMLLLPALLLPVSANSPPPAPYYTVQIENYPEGTVYVDLLIPLSGSDEHYVQMVEENIPEGFCEDAEILSYADDGYCSYTFHYQDAMSTMEFDKDGYVYFFTDTSAYIMNADTDIRYGHADEIYALGSIRFAMLDVHGDILHVSPILELNKKGLFERLENEFYYDVETEGFTVVYLDVASGRILFGMLCFVGMLFTCAVELLCAIPFGMYKRHKSRIVRTNVFSQVIMYTAYVMLYRVVFWKYDTVVILLEILVYAGELIWYFRSIPDISRKRIFAYTVMANTASLVLGKYLIYRMLI